MKFNEINNNRSIDKELMRIERSSLEDLEEMKWLHKRVRTPTYYTWNEAKSDYAKYIKKPL